MRFYTAQQVAEILQVNKRSVTRWIKAAELGASRLGNRYRISEEDLRKFLEKRRTNRVD